MLCTEAEYVDCLADHAREKNTFPDMSHAALTAGYPGHYQSLLQIVHTTGERINRTLSAHRASGTK
jgi:hypothetical protein